MLLAQNSAAEVRQQNEQSLSRYALAENRDPGSSIDSHKGPHFQLVESVVVGTELHRLLRGRS